LNLSGEKPIKRDRKNIYTIFFDRMPGLKSPLGLLIPLILIVVIISIINPLFISERNIINILRSISIVLVLASGMTIVMGGGGIDLSVGSIVALGSNAAGLLIQNDFSVGIAVAGALLIGLLAGTLNGISVSYFKIPPLITTLATLTIYRGVNYLVMKDQIVRIFPPSFKFIGQGFLGRVPMIFVIGVAVILIMSVFLNQTRTGKYILATGGNKETAKRCGLHTQRYQMISYMICGMCAGLGGLMLASRLNSTQAMTGIGMELHVIAVVVLGGTFLFGGYATILGTFLGALLIGIAENGLVLARVSFFYQQIVIGLILLITVGIQLLRFRASGISRNT